MEKLLTVHDRRPNRYPFAVGDRLVVNWHSRSEDNKPCRRQEYATVTKLLYAKHGGEDVIYCMLIQCDGDTNSRAVSEEICTKVNNTLTLF